MMKARHALCGLIDTVHKSRFIHTLVAAPVVRVPRGLHAVAAAVARGAKLLLGDVGLPRPLPARLQQRARVVCARGRTVAHILHGHRRLAHGATLAALQPAVDDSFVARVSDLAAAFPCLRPFDTHSGVCPAGARARPVADLSPALRTVCAPYCPDLPVSAAARLDALEGAVRRLPAQPMSQQ